MREKLVTLIAQVPSSIIFVKKMVQRCGVWQIKRMTSPDPDQVAMKSNMFGFRGHSQINQKYMPLPNQTSPVLALLLFL